MCDITPNKLIAVQKLRVFRTAVLNDYNFISIFLPEV
jgi:hypothetical protein